MLKPWKTNLSPKKYIKLKARTLPIDKCYINGSWEKCGLASVFIVRKHPDSYVTFGVFLVDILALGTKNCFTKIHCKKSELTEHLDYMEKDGDTMKEIPYDLAHNIIYGANAFAEEFDFFPHPDFEISQYILMEDTEDIPLIELEFGKDGKPLVIQSLGNFDFFDEEDEDYDDDDDK